MLSEPTEQFLACGLDEAASGEADVVGHLGHAVRRRHKRLGLFVSGELALREDQTLKMTVEDVEAQGAR
ncbi:hypothetical protein NKG94_00095 [Micromonospora sp. M12]